MVEGLCAELDMKTAVGLIEMERDGGECESYSCRFAWAIYRSTIGWH